METLRERVQQYATTTEAFAKTLRICAILFVLSCAYLLSYCMMGLNLMDEGVPLSGAMRVMDGELPQRDFYALEPGRYYLLAGLFKLFGPRLVVARVSWAVMYAAAAVLGYLAAQTIMPRRYAVGAAVMITGLPAQWYKCYFTFFSLLILCVALWLVRRRTLTGAFAAGLAVGLAYGFRSVLAVLGLSLISGVFVLSECAGPRGERLRRIPKACGRGALFLLAAALAASPTLILLSYLIRRTADPWGGVKTIRIAFPNLASALVTWLDASREGDWEVFIHALIFYLGPATILLCVVLLVRRWFQKGLSEELVRGATVTAFAIGTFAYVLPRADVDHLLSAMPGTYILMFFLAASVRTERRRIALAALLVLCVGYYGYLNLTQDDQGALIGKWRRAHRPLQVVGPPVSMPGGEGERVQVLLNYLKRNRRQGKDFFVLDFYPMLYFLTGQRCPSYFELIVPGLVDQEREAELQSLLEDPRIQMVILYEYPIDLKPENHPRAYMPAVWAVVEREYPYVSKQGRFFVYDRLLPKPLPQDPRRGPAESP